MDPIANIKEQVDLASAMLQNANGPRPEDSERLAELVIALDEWRKMGGFDPYTVDPHKGLSIDDLPVKGYAGTGSDS